MSTAIAIGASTLQLPDPGESYSVNLTNTNNTNIATEVNKTVATGKKSFKTLGWAGNATWGTVGQSAIVAGTADMDSVFGSVVVTTDGSGYAAIDGGFNFPNGYVVDSLINGDTIAQANITISLSTGVFTNTASRFYVRVVVANTGTALASGTCRINFRMDGW